MSASVPSKSAARCNLLEALLEQRVDDIRVSMATVAMAWVVRNPVVDSAIAGATKPHHLTDAVAALDLTLTDDELDALQAHYVPRQPTCFD